MRGLLVATLAIFCSASVSHAGACSKSIDKMQARVDAGLAATAGAGPSGKQSVGADLSHQPTPASIAKAEAALGEGKKYRKALAALSVARERDRAGNLAGCLSALRRVKRVLR